jgi:hypothetical protein
MLQDYENEGFDPSPSSHLSLPRRSIPVPKKIQKNYRHRKKSVLVHLRLIREIAPHENMGIHRQRTEPARFF